MTQAALLLLATISALVCTPASSQFSEHSLLGRSQSAEIPEGSLSDVDRARVALQRFARCTVSKSPNRIIALLRMSAGSEYEKALIALPQVDCLSDGELKIPRVLMRGAIFTELWRIHLIDAQNKNLQPKLTPIDWVAAKSEQEEPAGISMLRFAQCVIRRNPQGASDVVRYVAASKAQLEAYSRLNGDLGPCLLAGNKIRLSKSVLEGALAEVLYREPPFATQVAIVGK